MANLFYVDDATLYALGNFINEAKNNIFLKCPKKIKLSEIIERLNRSEYLGAKKDDHYNNFWYRLDQLENGKTITWIRFNHEFTNEYYKVHIKKRGKQVPRIKIINNKIINIYLGRWDDIFNDYKWLYTMWIAGTEIIINE